MPRLYCTPSTFLRHPLATNAGWAFKALANLDEESLGLELASASLTVDKACLRRFGLPGRTTLAAACNAGDSTISLTSLINLDDAPNVLLQIGSGGTQEVVQIGGTQPSSYKMPMPGTADLYNLATLQYAHAALEPVVGYWYDQENVLGSGTSGVDSYWDLTQEGQVAAAHAPRMGAGQMVRTIFLRAMPIVSLFSVSITYPWANATDPAVPSGVSINWAEGWYRFPVGYYVPLDSLITTAYRGGYQQVPEDIVKAVIYEAAGSLVLARFPYGANSLGSGVRHMSWSPGGKGNRPLLITQEADRICRMNKNLALA